MIDNGWLQCVSNVIKLECSTSLSVIEICIFNTTETVTGSRAELTWVKIGMAAAAFAVGMVVRPGDGQGWLCWDGDGGRSSSWCKRIRR